MGSDDIFHKLKKKAHKKQNRDRQLRDPYPKFLIICEDTVSGYQYLLDIVKYYKLSTANFTIVGLGESPLNIVQEAERKFNLESESHRHNFDQVFCVFDRDTHGTYYNAISMVDALNGRLAPADEPIFHAITSNPCFELWLLFHFVYTTQVFLPSHKKSAANNVEVELKKHLPSYGKSNTNVFSAVHEHVDLAIENSERAKNYCEKNYVDNPLTEMDFLMKFLMGLK
ncbi:RloB family protein [Vibrio splendidus]